MANYAKQGPFVNGAAPGITHTFLNGVEDWLYALGRGEIEIENADEGALMDMPLDGAINPRLSNDKLPITEQPDEWPRGYVLQRVTSGNGWPGSSEGVVETVSRTGGMIQQSFRDFTTWKTYRRWAISTTVWGPWLDESKGRLLGGGVKVMTPVAVPASETDLWTLDSDNEIDVPCDFIGQAVLVTATAEARVSDFPADRLYFQIMPAFNETGVSKTRTRHGVPEAHSHSDSLSAASTSGGTNTTGNHDHGTQALDGSHSHTVNSHGHSVSGSVSSAHVGMTTFIHAEGTVGPKALTAIDDGGGDPVIRIRPVGRIGSGSAITPDSIYMSYRVEVD